MQIEAIYRLRVALWSELYRTPGTSILYILGHLTYQDSISFANTQKELLRGGHNMRLISRRTARMPFGEYFTTILVANKGIGADFEPMIQLHNKGASIGSLFTKIVGSRI